MNIIMENSNKQAPNFLTKKLINFGDAHKEQTDLYLANIKQDKFYKQTAAQEAFFYSNLSPSSPK